MKEIILASTSPRRRQLMQDIGLIFKIMEPDYDENIINKQFNYELIESVARKKGESVAQNLNAPSIIISADTVVVLNNTILGKPKDFEDAKNTLLNLSDNTHIVVTAVCIFDNEKNKKIIKSETSYVTFNKLSQEDIVNYINTFKPFDKAGSYGIQELPQNFIKSVKGEYDNIVGLPTKMLIKMLQEINN